MDDDYKNEIIKRVRSCLISTQGQVSLRQLEDDYRTLLGERIPYQRLGHRTLESFIQSVPTLVTSRGRSGELYVDAKVSKESEHISKMVQKQKSVAPKKKVRIHAPKFNRTMTQPPPNTTRWRPQRNPYTPQREYERSPRLAAISHNQFVKGAGYNKPQVASKVVVPETSQLNNAQTSSPPRELRRYNSSPDEIVSDRNGINLNDGHRSSSMRRISRIMSGLSIDRDSGNSSPTTELVSNYEIVQEFIRTGDPVQDIRNFAAYHKLGDVEVRFTETKAKKSKIVQFHCKITVGQHKYSSYPGDFYDRETAERHASQRALDELTVKYSKRKSLLLSSPDDIIERIPPMLERHSAIWMWQIEADYIDRYNEQLPSDWLQIIDNNPNVSLEKCHGGYVLKHCNPDDVLQKGKKLDISLNVGDVSVPCNTVLFGENNRIYALITAAHSANEVWCQQIETPEYEQFRGMSTRMQNFYMKNKFQQMAVQITPGACYVVENDSSWLRVRAVDFPQKGYVSCFLIDYGQEVQVPVDSVYVMKRQWAVEQAQAFVCRLDGLEELYETSNGAERVIKLAGREVILELVEECSEDDIIFPVVMYDPTSGESINEELISFLTIESSQPVLEEKNINEVYVSNIEANGDVYVQVRTPAFHRLNEMLKNLTDTITKSPPSDLQTQPPTRETSENKLYLVKCNVSKKWLRATIIDWAPKGDLAQVYFIDVGNAQVISTANEKVYCLDQFSDVFTQYTAQAVKVRLMIEKIPVDFVQRAERLLPPEEPVLLKIVNYDNHKVAWVEFFKRTNDGVLVFINKNISLEEELQNFDVGSNATNNEAMRKRLLHLVQFGDVSKTVPSGGSLKKPDLPKVGAYFNVNIPFAVNPWNFFVQPLDSFNQLTFLMQDMQEYYNNAQFSPMQMEDIVPGKIYASKHDDGSWYRTSVLKVIHSGSISVFYCDFGYYTNLTLAQLVPLNSKYMSLPYQALKAKIEGIKPSKSKWTMEDCDFFNNLVTKKQFVSVLVSIEKDELYKSDMVLQLLLIDTSSDEDVNIKTVLIEKGIAISV